MDVLPNLLRLPIHLDFQSGERQHLVRAGVHSIRDALVLWHGNARSCNVRTELLPELIARLYGYAIHLLRPHRRGYDSRSWSCPLSRTQ